MQALKTCSAGSDTAQNKVLQGLIPRLTKLCGYQTPRNNVLRGIKPRGTTFKYEYFRKFETQFKNILGVNSGTKWGQFVEKTGGQKSHATIPLAVV